MKLLLDLLVIEILFLKPLRAASGRRLGLFFDQPERASVVPVCTGQLRVALRLFDHQVMGHHVHGLPQG